METTNIYVNQKKKILNYSYNKNFSEIPYTIMKSLKTTN